MRKYSYCLCDNYIYTHAVINKNTTLHTVCAIINIYFWPGCGGVIHADTGTIKSPNYPQNFPANVECSWQIIAHEGTHLEMNVNSDFEIPDSTGTCQNSYVKVSVLLSYSWYALYVNNVLFHALVERRNGDCIYFMMITLNGLNGKLLPWLLLHSGKCFLHFWCFFFVFHKNLI